ncbi:Probable mitochondrial-processing peptidase subunit beta [Galdieria sulphuraria]|nr:Probable mitochondrial-processing peptidase subunit beta [Galdieria sulphuraria]
MTSSVKLCGSAFGYSRRLNSLFLNVRSSSAKSFSSQVAESTSTIPPPVAPTFVSRSPLQRLKGFFGKYATALPPNYQFEPELQKQVPTRVSQLDNGLRVATEYAPTGTATLGVWIDAGTRFEPERVNGAAHFLEHLIFKGTTQRTQHQLEVEVEDIGAHLNAYTSREQTAYYARSLKEDVPQVLELLSDILKNSRFDAAAVERERDVILREMEEVNQQAEEVLFDYLHASAYQDTPLGRTILGPEENIRALTREDLMEYVKLHYKPHRMVLSVVGDVEHQPIVELAKKHFGGMEMDPTFSGVNTLVSASPAYFTGSDVRIRNDDLPMAHFTIAFETCGWTHPDTVALMVLQSLLGSWDRSSGLGMNTGIRLGAAVADTSCQSVMSYNTTYTDTGLFGVYAVAEPVELDDVGYAVLHELLKTNLLGQLDNTTAEAEEVGRQLLVYGRRIPLLEMFARIDAVDISTLKRVANRYIYDRDPAVAAMGPIFTLPDYNWIRRRTFWNRY